MYSRSKSNGSKWIKAGEASKEIEIDYLPWEVSQPNGYQIQVLGSRIPSLK
jgi:hypothetical protein